LAPPSLARIFHELIAATRNELMTKNDAEGILTAQRYDGHVSWLND
jgi:hypothetical protein